MLELPPMLANRALLGIRMVALVAAVAGCTTCRRASPGSSGSAEPPSYWSSGEQATQLEQEPARADAGQATFTAGHGKDDEYVPPRRLDPTFPSKHPRIYLNEESRQRLARALATGRPSATRFRTMVDQQIGGAKFYAFDPAHAALLYQVTGEKKYGTYAVNEVDTWVSEEERRIAAGQRPIVANDSYLYVGPRIGSLARTYDWCWDLITKERRERWLSYANQAVWNVWNHKQARWGKLATPWSGWATNNPSNNYYYSFLEATMTLGLASLGESQEGEDWLRIFRDVEIDGRLVPQFSRDLVGGGSREGTGYGTAMAHLFELYDIWEVSTGERIADLTPHARLSLTSFMHLTAPTLDRVAPVGDHARDSSAALFDYHRKYVQILAHLYKGTAAAAAAVTYLDDCSVPRMTKQYMFAYDFLYDDPSAPSAPLSTLYPAYHGAGTGQISVRSSWSRDATWVHFIAGPYTESHAHRDQGSILLFKREWLAYDQNIASHSGIRHEEEVHNLVRFVTRDGTVEMRARDPAGRLIALVDEPEYSYVAADLTPAYADNTAVTRSHRELVYVKPNLVLVFDRADGSKGTRRSWAMNSPVRPSVAGQVAKLAGSRGTLKVVQVHPRSGSFEVVDWSTYEDMPRGGFRLETRLSSEVSRFLHVLDVDGEVLKATSSDAAGKLGVLVVLASGRSVSAQWKRDSFGGTLAMLDADGKQILRADLKPGIAALPLLAAQP